MLTLFALLLVLFVFYLFAGGVPETLSYFFLPDFSKISTDTFLAALSQAFFSVGVAMSGMMMFGAYLPKSISVGLASKYYTAIPGSRRYVSREPCDLTLVFYAGCREDEEGTVPARPGLTILISIEPVLSRVLHI